MRRLTGFIMMATVAYAGHLAINHYFSDNFKEKEAFSNLRTKLQKTLVMIDVSPSETTQAPVKQEITKKSSATRPAPIITKKTELISYMKSTFDSLLEVRHIFRHEVSEMISIIEKSEPMTTLSPKLTYAKNWSNYIKNNVSKFNMGDDNKAKIENMVTKMGSYIEGLTKKSTASTTTKKTPVMKAIPVETKNTVKAQPEIQTLKNVETKKIENTKTKTEVKVDPVATGDLQEGMVKKSITESLQALKAWEKSRKEANSIVDSFSTIWLLVAGLFTIIGLWMSKPKNVEKLIVTESEETEGFELQDVNEVKEENNTVSDNEENHEEIKMFVSDDEKEAEYAETYFFDEISNSLSTLCQAKGIILDTDNLDNTREVVTKYNLADIEQEITDFTKTIIRSLGKEGTKTVKLNIFDKTNKLKMIASVKGDESLDVNMTRIASGFRDLEEKLSTRKGVFNIEQSISSNDIDFIMQLTAGDKSETDNVEQVETVPPTV